MSEQKKQHPDTVRLERLCNIIDNLRPEKDGTIGAETFRMLQRRASEILDASQTDQVRSSKAHG